MANDIPLLDPLDSSLFGGMLNNYAKAGTMIGGDQSRLDASRYDMTKDQYEKQLLADSKFRNSNAGKVAIAIQRSQQEHARQQAENTSFAKLIQNMSDRATFHNLSSEDFQKQMNDVKGVPEKAIDENGREVLRPVSFVGKLGQRALEIREMLNSNDPSLNKNDLANELNRTLKLQDYARKRNEFSMRQGLGITPDTIYKGITPDDVVKGWKANPKMAPADAAIIAHKQTNNLAMGMLDQGKLPTSSADLLVARSQLREDFANLGSNKVTLERAKLLEDLEPVIQAAEKVKAQKMRDQEKWDRHMKEKMLDFKLSLVKDILKEKLKANLKAGQPDSGNETNVSITLPQINE